MFNISLHYLARGGWRQKDGVRVRRERATDTVRGEQSNTHSERKLRTSWREDM